MDSSRTLANNLRKLADWLDSRPEFPVVNTTADMPYQGYDSDKASFIAAVKALGSGKKSDGIIDSYLRFTATGNPEETRVSVEIYRSAVCTLVRPARPAEYDCEPLLSQAEEASLEAQV